MLPKIHFINNVAAHYMEPLLLKLLQSSKINFLFSCGSNKNWGIKNVDFKKKELNKYSNQINSEIKNIWIKNKYLVWQRGVIKICLFGPKVDLMILLGEFVVLSNWIAAIICRIRRIPIAFRGHGVYGNEKYLKLLVRKNFYKLANYQLVYERRSKRLLIEYGFNKDTIHVIFNSLDYDFHKTQRLQLKYIDKSKVYNFFNNPDLPTLIFSGRLTKSKKMDMLLKVVNKLNTNDDGIRLNLLIIGDGEELDNLEDYARNNLSKGTYHFYGSCYDELILGKFLSMADLCVSPGNVGLTAIHSLSYGTPVCTHSNFSNQGPEAEAIEEDVTGFFFIENDIDDLYSKIKLWISANPVKTDKIISNCYKIIDDYYNPYFQERVFQNIAHQNTPIV